MDELPRNIDRDRLATVEMKMKVKSTVNRRRTFEKPAPMENMTGSSQLTTLKKMPMSYHVFHKLPNIFRNLYQDHCVNVNYVNVRCGNK